MLVASALLVVVRERDRDSAELAGRAVGAVVFALLAASVVWAIVYVAYRRKRGLEFFSPELLLLAGGIAFVSAVFLPATRQASATHEKLAHAVAECTDGAMDEYDGNPQKDEFPLTQAVSELKAEGELPQSIELTAP